MSIPRYFSAALCLVLSAQGAFGQDKVLPAFSIWDVVLGEPISQAPDSDVGEITCGTNGGPPGRELGSFTDFMNCTPEESGLREVQFSYDDEQDYIARALELEYKALQGGTSVYAHPVIVSVLVDPDGVVQGRRVVTDDRVADMVRRTAFTLIRNFKGRFGEWSLDCTDVPLREGEQKVGNQFVHELCTARSPDGRTRIALEATYLRKRGQQARNIETQEINTGYFESQTRFEEVLSPYAPAAAP
ncbi:hypothetical protein [Maritimibacter dapengensis]|uniref:Uncharacterized protein n=1 Tax=Maritimibacter dapengensis TaxID=2836868 RepID=A0ABS6T260_9RHOB|nr:hypothetical protein [Maritimibacter dapengensis]MBV7378452.1 hypothetical protein [Maritimibacter dapengensis]